MMVEAQERTGEERERYYTPERIGYWLYRWGELIELARRTPGSVRYGDAPEQHQPGRRPSDPMHYLDIQIDIEKAWASLPIWSFEWNAVKTIMDGYPLREMEKMYRLQHGAVRAALDRAIAAMAAYLAGRR